MVPHAAYDAGLSIFEIPNYAVSFVVIALMIGFVLGVYYLYLVQSAMIRVFKS